MILHCDQPQSLDSQLFDINSPLFIVEVKCFYHLEPKAFPNFLKGKRKKSDRKDYHICSNHKKENKQRKRERLITLGQRAVTVGEGEESRAQ